jgi:hypothetical protein
LQKPAASRHGGVRGFKQFVMETAFRSGQKHGAALACSADLLLNDFANASDYSA